MRAYRFSFDGAAFEWIGICRQQEQMRMVESGASPQFQQTRMNR